jgi:putative oxidoreductase
MINPKLNLRTLFAWTLVTMLFLAAISKITDLDEFYLSVKSYQLPLPDWELRAIAMVLPWLELLAAILLIPARSRRAGLFAAAILFGLFTLATGQAWARGLDISCGCVNLAFLGEKYAGMFDSAGFAFFRALVLELVAIGLLKSDV